MLSHAIKQKLWLANWIWYLLAPNCWRIWYVLLYLIKYCMGIGMFWKILCHAKYRTRFWDVLTPIISFLNFLDLVPFGNKVLICKMNTGGSTEIGWPPFHVENPGHIVDLRNYDKGVGLTSFAINIIIRVFYPRAGPSLQTQELRPQFCSKVDLPSQTQGCSFLGMDRCGSFTFRTPLSL